MLAGKRLLQGFGDIIDKLFEAHMTALVDFLNCKYLFSGSCFATNFCNVCPGCFNIYSPNWCRQFRRFILISQTRKAILGAYFTTYPCRRTSRDLELDTVSTIS